MKINPALFCQTVGAGNLAGNLRCTDIKGLYTLVSPVTLRKTETGETVQVNKFFHDEGNEKESMVRVVCSDKSRSWFPLTHFEFPTGSTAD